MDDGIMQPDDLSAKERAVVFTLMAEAREISNPELAQRAGFRLDGKERRKLNDLKLVESRMSGRTFAHELTDAGWRWCATQLSAGLPGKASSSEGALYAVLDGLARYLDYTDQTLADLFRQRAASEISEVAVDIDVLIKSAYHRLAAEPAEFVKLRELRSELPDVPRAQLDSALEQMYRTRQVNLVPQSNQQALTQADRDAALRIGGEAKHMISVSRG